jgi:hypothetical protein
MKKINVLCISLFAFFALSSIAASSAFAEETAQWLVSGATIALGTEVNTDITTNATGILLEDMKATLKPDVLCTEIEGLGFLYSNGEDRIESGKCLKGESMTSGVTCTLPEPVNLPWLTQLLQIGTEYFDDILNGGKGEPGWHVECTALGVKVSDVCTTETGKPKQINLANEEVESLFSETEEANCTVGGVKEGLIFGSLFIDALSASGTELLALTVSLTAAVE